MEKTDWIEMCDEAEKLPMGSELETYDRYNLMIAMIEAIDNCWPWQFKQKRFYRAVLSKLAS